MAEAPLSNQGDTGLTGSVRIGRTQYLESDVGSARPKRAKARWDGENGHTRVGRSVYIYGRGEPLPDVFYVLVDDDNNVLVDDESNALVI